MDTGEENKDEEQEAAKIKKTEPPTKKLRQNKVCSYFPFAISITGAYDAKALVSLHDLTTRLGTHRLFVLKVSQSQRNNHFTYSGTEN